MLENIWTVAQQVAVLFILIGVGFICGKTGLISDATAKKCSDLTLIIITPCMIIKSFQRPFDPSMFKGLGLAFLIALLIHIGSILLIHLTVHDKDIARQRVLRVGALLSNAGFMGLPLQEAIVGEDGVFYGATYVAVFNLFLWSYGLFTMSGDRKSLSPKKLIINPGLIALAIGLVLFLTEITLPSVLAAPVNHLANMNTPLPMLIIGFYLAGTNLMAALKDTKAYLAIGLRLLIIPLLALGGMWLCGVRGNLLIACTISASAPVAAATTMFSTRFGNDTNLSVNMVSLSTLLSILTMPVTVALAQLLA